MYIDAVERDIHLSNTQRTHYCFSISTWLRERAKLVRHTFPASLAYIYFTWVRRCIKIKVYYLHLS